MPRMKQDQLTFCAAVAPQRNERGEEARAVPPDVKDGEATMKSTRVLAFVLAGGYAGYGLDQSGLVALHRLTVSAASAAGRAWRSG